MSEIETPAAKPKPKRKARRTRKAPARTAAPKAAPGFAGLTVADCCNACNAQGCVISGQNYCGHPRKGGLQGASMNDAAALKRLQAAQKLLATDAAEKRFT